MQFPTRSFNLPINYYRAPLKPTAGTPRRDGHLIVVDLDKLHPRQMAFLHAWEDGARRTIETLHQDVAAGHFRDQGFLNYEKTSGREFRHARSLRLLLLEWLQRHAPPWCAGWQEHFQLHVTSGLVSDNPFFTFEAPDMPSPTLSFDQLFEQFV